MAKIEIELKSNHKEMPTKEGEYFCIITQKNVGFSKPLYAILVYNPNSKFTKEFHNLQSGKYYYKNDYEIIWAELPDRNSDSEMLSLLNNY